MTKQSFAPAVFQNFTDTVDPQNVAPRLSALRAELKRAGFDGFLIPRADAHRGESVPPGEARLAYVTGFTGSAGIAVIGTEKAALLIDSRYTIQAPAQTDTKLIDVIEVGQGGLSAQIGDYVRDGGQLAYDPWLHSPGEIKDLAAKLAGRVTLVPTANLVDAIWTDRPGAPVSPIEFLGPNRSGQATGDKIAQLQQTLSAQKADAVVLTLPESICWLFNMRGRDVPNTPFVLSFAIVPANGQPKLFLDAAKITPELQNALDGIAQIIPSNDLSAALQELGKAGKTVWIDPATAPLAISTNLTDSGATLIEQRDPVLLPKAIKNDVEIAGMREAHKRDAVALIQFLHWFDQHAPSGNLSEIDIVTALEAFRRQDDSCVDASFDTISGAGAHGAIVHYRVTTKTDRNLQPGELMLLDSGAQYLSGTTDITRTMSSGSSTPEQRDRFTRVLKGMIAVSLARFPHGTAGAQLDVLARQYLWEVGQTYSHGTGHGVGAFLGVHEGPIGIGPGARFLEPLQAGMILSNEPGFYKAGEYGIRIENLVVVNQSKIGDNYLDFETLTLVPIDTRLIEGALMLAHERDWLNQYHQKVWDEIGPRLDGAAKDWLKTATAAI